MFDAFITGLPVNHISILLPRFTVFRQIPSLCSTQARGFKFTDNCPIFKTGKVRNRLNSGYRRFLKYVMNGALSGLIIFRLNITTI